MFIATWTSFRRCLSVPMNSWGPQRGEIVATHSWKNLSSNQSGSICWHCTGTTDIFENYNVFRFIKVLMYPNNETE